MERTAARVSAGPTSDTFTAAILTFTQIPGDCSPWDLGYPDLTGYGCDYDTSQPNIAQVELYGEEQQEPPESVGYPQPEYVPAPYQPPANQAAAPSPAHMEPQLTLIFKDGHTRRRKRRGRPVWNSRLSPCKYAVIWASRAKASENAS